MRPRSPNVSSSDPLARAWISNLVGSSPRTPSPPQPPRTVAEKFSKFSTVEASVAEDILAGTITLESILGLTDDS